MVPDDLILKISQKFSIRMCFPTKHSKVAIRVTGSSRCVRLRSSHSPLCTDVFPLRTSLSLRRTPFIPLCCSDCVRRRVHVPVCSSLSAPPTPFLPLRSSQAVNSFRFLRPVDHDFCSSLFLVPFLLVSVQYLSYVRSVVHISILWSI